MSPIKSASVRVLRSKPLVKNNARVLNTTERSVGMTTTTTTSPGHPSTKPNFPTPVHYSPQSQTTTKTKMIANNSQNPFDRLQTSLSSHLASHPPSALSPTLPALFRLLREYTSDAADWARFAHSNAEKQYTRNLVCEVPGLFNLLLLVWTPGKKSPVHDHADSHCLMKILKGNLVETRYAIPTNPGLEGPLHQTSCKKFNRDQVTYMSDAVSYYLFPYKRFLHRLMNLLHDLELTNPQLGLHEISNPSPTEYAVSLHLYTPPNAALRGCHIYDKADGEAIHVMQGAYDSVLGVANK
ncbi:hypothetical protein HYALB_00011456 [Hymenoscyphus albidus]|uniref:Cysteine dioxygenase n=1 Tax=Hymenoscyphus albidus TaxID=595503 RepID=A0A9N9LYD1_9HELO|nr:hypothetical protein HYALB_00011456 [Hymenoscyphus albidus]